MDKTIGALRKLLNLLYQEQDKAWNPQRRREGKVPSASAQDVWEELNTHYWVSVGDSELEKCLPASDKLHIDFSEMKRVLYLPPLEKDSEFVPVLSLKCDMDKTQTRISLRVMLVCRNQYSNKLCGLGFRLESPESENQNEGENKKGGRHDFYHAQLIQDFGHKPSVESPSWLPVTQPSFPLTADCPVTLIFSLLLTLYGKNYCWNFYTKHRQQLGDLKQYMKKLDCWINWGSFT